MTFSTDFQPVDLNQLDGVGDVDDVTPRHSVSDVIEGGETDVNKITRVENWILSNNYSHDNTDDANDKRTTQSQWKRIIKRKIILKSK